MAQAVWTRLPLTALSLRDEEGARRQAMQDENGAGLPGGDVAEACLRKFGNPHPCCKEQKACMYFEEGCEPSRKQRLQPENVIM